VLLASLRDLQWRRKRFGVAVFAVGLTLGLSLLMSGVSSAFPLEARRVVDAMGARSFLVPNGEIGVFTSSSVVSADALPGARSYFFMTTPVKGGKGVVQTALVGIEQGGPTRVSKGQQLAADGEVVVDVTLGRGVGETIRLSGRDFRVVGTTRKTTLYGGQPVVFVGMNDVRGLVAQGRNVTKGFVETTDAVGDPPAGFQRVSRSAAINDLLRPLRGAQQTLVVIMTLLWLISAAIIGSVMFLTVLERIRDFAVFKANGVRTREIAIGLILQAVVLAIAASIIGVVLGLAMQPLLELPVEISTGWILALPVIAVGVAAVASLFGMRRAVRIEPALAFGAA
jgi:putative ABC transport system permease protein